MNRKRILVSCLGLLCLLVLQNCVVGTANWIFFIEQPASIEEAGALEISATLHYEAGSDLLSTTDSTVWCAALPSDWSTTGPVTFQIGSIAGGLNTNPEAAFYLELESTDMNDDKPVSTGGLQSIWSCYGFGEGRYTGLEMWKYTMPAEAGAAGIYTLYYAAWSDKAQSQGRLGDRLEKKTVVGGDAGAFDQWELVNGQLIDSEVVPPGTTASYVINTNIVYGGGVWVLAAGDPFNESKSYLLKSDDGETWELVRTLGGLIFRLNFNEGVFAAVALDTGSLTGSLWTSSDGQEWSPATTGINLRSAVYADGRYVAVGLGGQVAWSDNGSSWNVTVTGIGSWQDVTWGGGQFAAIGGIDPGTGMEELAFMTSPDGVSWTSTVLTDISAGSSLPRIIYGEGQFLATSDKPVLYSSSTGSTWSSSRIADSENTAAFGIAAGNGTIMVTGVEGNSGFNSGVVYTYREDGPWEKWYPGTSEWLMDVQYNRGEFTVTGTGFLVMKSGTRKGGGGGGGCNTAGPAPGELIWPEMSWTILLGASFLLWRRKRTW